ncbi:MAG TPA: hypothetical protein PLY70_01305 [Saprospiraceae bacterium]|nr:hypothetical protein [Saprospiraceae bacterium]HPN67921.1 hypothetical protein [Saprospiraceae bacterium]
MIWKYLFVIILVLYLFRNFITINFSGNKPLPKQPRSKPKQKDVDYIDYEEVD